MTMRLYVAPADATLAQGAELELPPGASRHAQVRRVQPGDALRLFDGAGRDWPAEVLAVTRKAVVVRVGAPLPPPAPEAACRLTLALVVPANERMDFVVEKAAELGVAALQPLQSERSVLRLAGERAARKREHWQAVAAAACEQCGRAVLPGVEPVRSLGDWLASLPVVHDDERRLLLALDDGAAPLPGLLSGSPLRLLSLSGPEGGLTPAEIAAARSAGFAPTSLGPRVLRADTAPLVLAGYASLLETN